MVDQNQFRSDAWLLWGLTGHLPGRLLLDSGYLSYRANSFGTLWKRQLEKLEQQAKQPGLAQRLNNAKSTLVLHVPIKEAVVSFPWYYFRGGMKLQTGGTTFRFSFARPNSHHVPGERPRIGGARKIGKAWQSLFSQYASTDRQQE